VSFDFTDQRTALAVTESSGHAAPPDVTLYATPEEAVAAAGLSEEDAEVLAGDLFLATEDAYYALVSLNVGVTLLEAADGLGDPEVLA
jgi:hypothetical protein